MDFDDFFDLVLLACASCRVGVGRPFAPDDGVGRFLGGVTRLLVGVDADFAAVASFVGGFLALLFFALPAPLVSAAGPARSRLACAKNPPPPSGFFLASSRAAFAGALRLPTE